MASYSFASAQNKSVEHSVYTGYSGFWWANNASPFRHASEMSPRLPSVTFLGPRVGINPAWIVPKLNVGYRRRQGRSMIELLYLYKEAGGDVSIASSMRRLELNLGYNIVNPDRPVRLYAIAGVTYLMQAVRASDKGFDRGYSVNLGLQVNYDITPAIYATVSIAYSESWGNDYRTIRHLVGVGYRWPRTTSHYTDATGRLLARCCH